jgi:hypothetical protein
MDNSETLATFGTQETRRRHTQKKHIKHTQKTRNMNNPGAHEE